MQFELTSTVSSVKTGYKVSYLVEEGVPSHVEDVDLDFSVSDLDPEIFRDHLKGCVSALTFMLFMDFKRKRVTFPEAFFLLFLTPDNLFHFLSHHCPTFWIVFTREAFCLALEH